MTTDRRKSLDELIGADFGSSRLVVSAMNDEGPIVRIAALGLAELHIRHGADRSGPKGRGGPVAEQLADKSHQVRDIDLVAGELATLMIRIRYGRQHEHLPRAIVLFASYLGMRRRFTTQGALAAIPARDRAGVVLRLATRVIHESLSDRCIPCGGSGKLERSESGAWVKPRGLMKRNATYRACTHCHGSRRPIPSQTERRKAIGLSFQVYQDQRWGAHFQAAKTWLETQIMRRIRRPLTAQLERGRKAS